jgi:hypothetical protein
MQICNFLFSWQDFIATYDRLNSHYLEILRLQQFKIHNSKFKISQLAALPRWAYPKVTGILYASPRLSSNRGSRTVSSPFVKVAVHSETLIDQRKVTARSKLP